jgi:redox-sensitive bicupin YhaK (pirin superfamily)
VVLKAALQHDEYYDPFVLLDHLGPLRVQPGEAPHSDDHPHRGVMTATYAVQGTVHCHDYSGFDVEMPPGGVIWLASGNGAVHSEKPTERFFQEGGGVPSAAHPLWDLTVPHNSRRTCDP